jgi:DNA-directed RNA polymerase sigma subunit (sigma70/sigma32)
MNKFQDYLVEMHTQKDVLMDLDDMMKTITEFKNGIRNVFIKVKTLEDNQEEIMTELGNIEDSIETINTSYNGIRGLIDVEPDDEDEQEADFDKDEMEDSPEPTVEKEKMLGDD